MLYRYHLVSILALLSLVTACGRSEPEPQSTAGLAPYVVAVNSPLAYFARRLLGGTAEVVMPAPAGSDPAQWRPKIDDIQRLQGAELVLLNGAGYSPWLTQVSLSDSRIVVTSEAARERWIALENQVTHSHGPQGDHAHGTLAFTTWMDISLATVQAESVSLALQQQFPDQADNIAGRAATLLKELDDLDKDYSRITSQLADRQLIYSHPVYQYFEARYGLPGLSLHWEPNAMPTDSQWRSLAENLGSNAVFVWESTPDTTIAARMRELGVQQLTLDPGGNIGAKDWLALQRSNLQALTALPPSN